MRIAATPTPSSPSPTPSSPAATSGGNECHGWMGVKFQSHPRDEPSQIIVHVRMLDNEAGLQQEALGIVGVNLLHGAFFEHHEPEQPDREPARPADHRAHRDRHDPVQGHRVPLGRQPADGAQAGPARAQRRGHVRARPRGAAAERGPAQEGDPGRARLVPPAHRGQHRHAGHGAREVRGRPGQRGPRDPGPDRADHAQPARRRQGRRPPRLPGPRRPARRVREDRADLRLRRVPPPGRLPGLAHRRADRHRDGRAEPDRPVRRGQPHPAARRHPGELRTAVQERPQAVRLPDAQGRGHGHGRERHRRGRSCSRCTTTWPGAAASSTWTTTTPDYLPILSRDVLRRIAAGDTAWEKMVPVEVAELIKKRSFFGYHRSQDD